MSKRLIVLAALACGAFSVSAADVYRWVDEQGKVQYGEYPPAGVKDATRVKVQAPATAATDAPASTATDGSAPPPGEALSNDDVAREGAALRQQRCTAAREQLKKYDDARYMVTKDANGQQRRATLEEEAAERLRVKREIDQNCSG